MSRPIRWCAIAALLATHAVRTSPLDAQSAAPEFDVEVTALLNGYWTDGATNNVDLPQFARLPDGADSLGTTALGGTVRQSRVQARVFWADVAGGELRAELDVDFFGGQAGAALGRVFPVVRLRRAVAELAWDRGRVRVGQDVPLIAELNPSSLAAVGLSAWSASGNLWLWIPQVRGALELAPRARVRPSIELAVLAPTGTDAPGPLLVQPDRAELSGRPYLQGRVQLRWGSGATAGEVGLGGHLGWLATTGDSVLTSRALAAALRLPLGARVELRGEAFAGQALAGLGGGGIGQNLGAGGVPVRTRGGWAQLLVRPGAAWELGATAGVDDPDDADLEGAQRRRNVTSGGHVHWSHAPLIVGLEFRRIVTRYASGSAGANHLNLAAGLRF